LAGFNCFLGDGFPQYEFIGDDIIDLRRLGYKRLAAQWCALKTNREPDRIITPNTNLWQSLTLYKN
jgi:hypothetical protein